MCRIYYATAILLGCTFIVGCYDHSSTKEPEKVLVVVNNTGESILIDTKGDGIQVPKDSLIEMKLTGDDINCQIRMPDLILHYRFRLPGEGFMRNHRARLQIEPGGDLYALPADARGVVSPLPRQPDGYPVKPKSVNPRIFREGNLR
jgi:hypothetical protein